MSLCPNHLTDGSRSLIVSEFLAHKPGLGEQQYVEKVVAQTYVFIPIPETGWSDDTATMTALVIMFHMWVITPRLA